MGFCVAEVQSQQTSHATLQEEVEKLQAQVKQVELDRDSQLSSLKEQLVSQTEQLDSSQSRVSPDHKTFPFNL